MAPVLQCPDCGEKHPIDRVPAQGAFPCQGCGRVLKVPEVVGRRAAAAGAAVAPMPRPVPVATAVVGASTPSADPAATGAVPELDGEALGALGGRSSRRPVARLAHVPWWMRLLLWFVAVPVGFLLVFFVARAFSLFTSNDLSDLFLANNTARFWPAVRLLPFVALVTAALVQGGVYLLARLRGRMGARGTGAELSASAHRPRA